MPKSLRLGSDLEKALDRYCAETGETTSAVIRQSVSEYIVRRRRKRAAPTAWELGKDLFGSDRSAGASSNVSGRVKSLIRKRPALPRSSPSTGGISKRTGPRPGGGSSSC